jgi:peptidoglycan/xylan/chitin deacetylase (PgdA/CDA1 family)
METKGLILLYHRVAEVSPDPWSLCVSPHHFSDHVKILKDFASPVSLCDVVKEKEESTLPERWFSVTFDDGYADNLSSAKPILQKYDIPAMLFLVTNSLDNDREFWWDELEQILLQPGTLPEYLELSIGGHVFYWNIEETNYTRDNFENHRSWKVSDTNYPTSRHILYSQLHQLLQPLQDDTRKEILDILHLWAQKPKKVRKTHRCLSSQEVRALGGGDIISIGSHSVTHLDMSRHEHDIQRNEIQESKQYLENLLDHPITGFSYPHGRYTEDTLHILKDCGFAFACTVIPRLMERTTNFLEIPRLQVEDWDCNHFEKQLSVWLE